MKSETADEMFHGTVFPLMGLKKLPVAGHRVTVAAGRMDDDFLNTTGRNLTRVRNRVRLILCALLLILFLPFAFVSCSPRQQASKLSSPGFTGWCFASLNRLAVFAR